MALRTIMNKTNVFKSTRTGFTIALFIGFIIIILLTPVSFIVTASSTWYQTSRSDFFEGTYENISIIGNGDVAELRIDTSKIQNWHQEAPPNTPFRRYGHAMTTIYGKNRLLLYGGSSYGNETWVYDPSDNIWTDKTRIIGPGYRTNHAMASFYETDKVILFGGEYGGAKDDTWMYNASTNTWAQEFHTIKPSFRYDHAMATIHGTDKVLLFGGTLTGVTRYNDTWIYDLSNGNWTDMKPQGTVPSQRNGHAMATIYGTQKVLLFGGYDTWYNSETWLYDLNTNSWSEVIQTTKPTYRYGHAMATIFGTDQILLFGGQTQNGNENDTWVYDLSEIAWVEKTLSIKPSTRRYSTMAPVYGTDRIVLFGGQDDYSNQLNDTWDYKDYLQTTNGTYVSIPFDTGTKSYFNTIDWNSNTPPGTSIKFQLRTAEIEAGLSVKKFVGPGGLKSSYYTSYFSPIWSGHRGDRWVQYKGYLNMSSPTPQSPRLFDVTIYYNCLPTAILSAPKNQTLISSNQPTFSWTINDLDSNAQSAFQVLIDEDITFTSVDYDSDVQTTSRQKWEFPDGTSYNTIKDGDWYWKVSIKDNDGNWGEYSEPWVFTLDSTPPISDPTTPLNDGSYNGLDTITGIASDGAGSGVTKVEIAIKRVGDDHFWDEAYWSPFKTWVTVSGGAEWIYDSSLVQWTSGTRYVMQSRATDIATNTESPSVGNLFLIDMDSPHSIIEIPGDNAWLNNLEKISGSSYDVGGFEIERNEICIKCINENSFWDGTSWKAGEHWLNVTGTDIWFYNTPDIDWDEKNQYIIYSRAIDKAGNIEFPLNRNIFRIDNQPPEKLSVLINNGDEYTNSKVVTLSLYSEDAGAGTSEMSFSTNSLEWTDWDEFNSSSPFTLPEGDGEKIVYFKTKDAANNIAEPVFDTIIIDTAAPEEVSIEINDKDKYTNSETVILTLNATDPQSGISDMSFSADGTEWSSWETFNPTKEYLLPAGNGEKIVYFRVRDKLENSAVASDTIILDTSPPHSLKLEINDGAYETKSKEVTLKLYAVDDLSGTYKMSFSIDDGGWSAWENFSTTKAFKLSGKDGTKKVYFRVKDSAGNIADPVGAAIKLKTPSSDTISTVLGDISYSALIGIVIAIIIIICILIIFIIMRRRKKKLEAAEKDLEAAPDEGKEVKKDEEPGKATTEKGKSEAALEQKPKPATPSTTQLKPKVTTSPPMTQTATSIQALTGGKLPTLPPKQKTQVGTGKEKIIHKETKTTKKKPSLSLSHKKP